MRGTADESASRSLGDHHLDVILKRISLLCFSTTLAVSIVSLLGWYSGSLIIASIKPGYIPIAPSSAFCFFIFSSSLLVYVLRPASPGRRLLAGSGATLIFSICLAILFGYVLRIKFDVEHLGIKSPGYVNNIASGYMSPVTSILFLMASSAFMFLLASEGLPAGRPDFRKMASYMAMAVVSIGFIIILGYLQGAPLLYGGSIIPVALPAAIAFELVGLGILTAIGPDTPLIRVFAGTTVINRLMRAFVPATILLTLIDGLLYHAAFVTATNPALAASLIALLSAAVVGIITSRIARAVGSDIDRAHAERDRLEEALKESAMNDALTGLHNRRFLQEFAGSLVAGALRRGKIIGLIMCDLDFFKQVNDTYGHDTGDTVLKETAELLKRSIRAADIVIRLGGEEFLIVLMDVAEGESSRIAEIIRGKIESTGFEAAVGVLMKTISLGVSEFPLDTEDFWQGVKFADVALYEAKNSGRNKCVRFSKAMWKRKMVSGLDM